MLLVFSCVLLHELGHALAARRYGIKTRDIVLLPIGGVARLERMPEKPQQEMVVAIAGPLVNVVIAGILFTLVGWHHSIIEAIERGGLPETLLLVNVVMIAFNLIPAFPMDGGRMLRAGLALAMPYPRATRIASTVGQGIAVLFGLVALFPKELTHGLIDQPPMTLMFIALFVFIAASEERKSVDKRTTLAGLPVRDAMVTDFRWLEVSDPLQRAIDFLMSGSQQDFPVLEQGVPIGILTRSDLVRGLKQHGAAAPVGSVIRRELEFAEAFEPLEAAIQRMRAQARSALPVLHHGGLVGLITLDTIGDLLTVRDALRRHQGGASVA